MVCIYDKSHARISNDQSQRECNCEPSGIKADPFKLLTTLINDRDPWEEKKYLKTLMMFRGVQISSSQMKSPCFNASASPTEYYIRKKNIIVFYVFYFLSHKIWHLVVYLLANLQPWNLFLLMVRNYWILLLVCYWMICSISINLKQLNMVGSTM